MRRTPRGNEQIVAPRPGTGRFFPSLGWALTLALGLDPLLRSGLLRLTPPAHPFAIPATLLAATLPAPFRLPPRLARAPTPPAIGRLLTRRTAIPRLRVPGPEELPATLQQAATASRPPRRALPRKRSSIMLKRTQGSVNSQRSSPGEVRSSPGRLIPAALSLGLPPLQTNRPPPRPPPPTRRPPVGRHRPPPATRPCGRRNGSMPGRR